MPRVRGKPDVFGIGQLHYPPHVGLALHGPPDMRVRSDLYAHRKRLPPDLVQRVSESLELIVGRPASRAVAHVALPVTRAERVEKIAGKRHMVGNGLGDLV